MSTRTGVAVHFDKENTRVIVQHHLKDDRYTIDLDLYVTLFTTSRPIALAFASEYDVNIKEIE